MSTIILVPDEEYEHSHSAKSTTLLVSGSVKMDIAGEVFDLEPNVPVSVPAGVSHRMVNVGSQPATVNCLYDPK